MKKLFIVAGEVSGDRIAGWYLKKRLAVEQCSAEGIAGDVAVAAGMKLYERFDGLNVVGLFELVKHVPRLFQKMRRLVAYILASGVDEVILVDFPGFNMRLARQLKKQQPSLRIIYVSPPQLWAWGAWRMKALKRFTDGVVVMYPFEVAWYKERGLTVSWLGSPVAEHLAPYAKMAVTKEPVVVLLPASRMNELEMMFPLFLAAIARVRTMHQKLVFVVPVPQSLCIADYVRVARKHQRLAICETINFVTDEHEKFQVYQRACVALAKPGTVTLELGLLRVPTVVAFKTSWLTYFMARLVVRVNQMSLPNLLTEKNICTELIQQQCTVENLVREIDALVHLFLYEPAQYERKLQGFDALDKVLCHR